MSFTDVNILINVPHRLRVLHILTLLPAERTRSFFIFFFAACVHLPLIFPAELAFCLAGKTWKLFTRSKPNKREWSTLTHKILMKSNSNRENDTHHIKNRGLQLSPVLFIAPSLFTESRIKPKCIHTYVKYKHLRFTIANA